MNNENYLVIQGWMINELGLSGNELLAYAIVYSFSQDGKSVFKGSSSYVADALNVSKRTAMNLLNSLTEKGFIIKEQETLNNVSFNRFYANLDLLSDFMGSEKTSLGVVKKFHGGSEKISPSNNKGNIKSNKKYISKDIYKEVPPELLEAFKEFGAMREFKKKPLTENIVKRTVKKLNTLTADAEEQNKILIQSVNNYWLDVYPLKEKQSDTATSGSIDWENA